MTEEPEELKELASVKTHLERRLKELEEELKHLKLILSFVDAQLVKKSFKPAVIAPKVPEYKQVIPLKTKTGIQLASMYVGDDHVRIVPQEGMSFNVSTPPFEAFLVNRILNAMVEKDKAEAEAGKLRPGNILSYEVVKDGDVLKEVLIRNYRSESRLREIRTSARWTFERMYEKIIASTR
jgi:hypothetical protein